MKYLAAGGGLIITFWILYGVAGRALADAIAQRLGGVVSKLGEGKFSSAAGFIYHRIGEVGWVLTLLLAWIVLHGVVQAVIAKARRFQVSPWIIHGLIAIIAFNVWLYASSRTAAFWIANWDGGQTQNLTRFHIKRILAEEQPAQQRAALVGSSQTRAQIDEAVLNAKFSTRLRTTDLAYPGSKALDVLLIQDRINSTKPDYVIWYVSEAMFYSGSTTEVTPNFLKIQQLPDLVQRKAIRFISPEYLASGLLGAVLPAFRLREVLTQRILGPQIGNLQQGQYDATLELDLSARAKRAAQPYQENDESLMQQRAMEDFVRRSAQLGQKVVLLPGQLHPLLQNALDPSLRPRMLEFLSLMEAKYPNVVLVDDLPPQSAADYDDLTHVNRATQSRFSTFLASELERMLVQTNGVPR